VHPAFYLETKAPGGVLSNAQRWMHRVLAAWHLPVVTIDDVDELAEWLRAHEIERNAGSKPPAQRVRIRNR
jgi:hypothetical protein